MNRAWVVLAGLAVGLAGCVGAKAEKAQGRSQVGDDPPAADPAAPATVGQKSVPQDLRPVPVSGVGLVIGLEPGAGGGAPAGQWRTMLENALKRDGLNVKMLLDDPQKTTALVLVSALVPAGAAKHEAVDLHLSVPDDSPARSLKGGRLVACELFDYDTTGNLASVAKLGQPGAAGGRLLLGSVWVKTVDDAPVTAGVEVAAGDGGDEPRAAGGPPSLRAGRVWAGGRVTRPRPYYFLLNPGDANWRTAAAVAERLNATFGGGPEKVAEAKRPDLVVVTPPYAYRHNHTRFLLAARQVPLDPVGPDGLYRRKLEDELLDPAACLRAAIKLEALGGDAKRALRVGLESQSPWVRFAAAESLAHLGHSDGAWELARLAEEHPALRAPCLKALAVGNDAAFTDRLAELMAKPDAQLRYGAFVALRLAEPTHPAVAGRRAGHSLWVHRVAAGSPGLVHLATGGRAEVVVFGDGAALRGPLAPLPLGADFTVSVPAAGAEAKVTRIVKGKDGAKVLEERCPADVGAVLVLVARMGGGWPEAVELVKRAAGAEALSVPVAVDAVPRQMTVGQLAALAPSDPAVARANAEVVRAGADAADPEAGLDLADADPEVKPAAAEVPAQPTLSQRGGGRLFGPKPPPEPAPAAGEPLTPVVPAGGAAPADAPKPAADRGRNPGTLFPRK